MANTPNMNLPIPTVSVTAGPLWATQNNSCFTLVDSHDHTPGNGVQITPDGINISSDLPFNSQDATLLRSVRFEAQGSPLGGAADLGCIYESGVDLYYNDGNGNQVRMTSGGGVAGSAGSIGSLSSPAAATYVAGSTKFQWTSDSGKFAAMENGALIIHETNTGSTNSVTISSPTGLAASYGLTLLSSLPGAKSYLSVSAVGALASNSADTIAAEMTSTGATAILNSAGTWATFSPSVIKDTGAGTLNSSTVSFARYLFWSKFITIQMKVVNINISGGTANLKFTAPAAASHAVKIPIWTQATLTSAIGRMTTTASSAVIQVGSGIDGGGFSAATTNEFEITATYEVA